MKIKYALMVIVFLLIFSDICFTQWSTDPAENTRISTYGLGPFITADGSGGGIIAWHDDYYYIDIVAQRVDSAGYIKWSTDGVPICREKLDQSINDIIEDGQGGAFIVWRDYRRSVKPGYMMDSSDVYMQHIDSNGQVLWQEDGIRISNGINYATRALITSDDSGGVVIAWHTKHSYDYPLHNVIHLQRISSSGVFLWPEDSVQIPFSRNEPNLDMALINDERDGFLLSCEEGIFRFDKNGEITWHVADIPGRMTDYSLISDGAGGGIFWYTNHVNFNYDLYIQRVNSNGELIWGEDGIFVTAKIPRYWGTSLAPDGEHGAYISWIDSSYTYHYNRIDSCGILLWDDNNKMFGFMDLFGPNLISDDNDGVIAVFGDSSKGSSKGYIQKMDRNGNKLWKDEGVLFSYYALDHYTDMISDGNEGIIFTWYERDWEPHYGIFAQRINKYGQLGTITTVKQPNTMPIPFEYNLSQNWPNPFNNQTKIQYKLPQNGKVTLIIFNVQGKEVKTLINEEQSKGSYYVIWNGKDNQGGDAATGIYSYQLKINEFVQTKKLTLIR